MQQYTLSSNMIYCVVSACMFGECVVVDPATKQKALLSLKEELMAV